MNFAFTAYFEKSVMYVMTRSWIALFACLTFSTAHLTAAVNPDVPTINVVSLAPSFDLGAITLASVNWQRLEELRALIAAKQSELDGIKADGEITGEESTRIVAIRAELEAVQAQIDSFIPSQDGNPAWPASTGPITIKITGTSGYAAYLEITDVSLTSEPKYGSGLGSLSATSGTIPFEVTFIPNKNYGKCKIKGTIVDFTVSSTADQLIKGQSKTAAKATEQTRFDDTKAQIEASRVAANILIGIFAAILLALLGILFGATIIAAVAIGAIGLVIGTAVSSLVDKLSSADSINESIHSSTDSYIDGSIPNVP